MSALALDALRSRWFWAAAEAAWLLFAVPWMLLQRRSPLATLAWILVLAAVPFLGIPVYLVLGPDRLRRRRLRMALARRAVGPALRTWAQARAVDLSAAEQLQRVAACLDGAAPETAELALLADGDACADAIAAAIAAARHHVHAEYYIFAPDRCGARVRDALAAAARRGVAVRLLVDAAGSSSLSRRFLEPLAAAGGRVARFNPVWNQALGQRVANFRTHRKILIADGRVGFTGGMNVTDDQSRRARGEAAWRDTHLRIEGAAVHGLQAAFLENWFFATRHQGFHGALEELRPFFPPSEPGTQRVQIVASGPDQDPRAVEAFYFAACALARERLWITAPYFVPDEPIAAALSGAALRGVDVRLLLPLRSDSRVVDAAGSTFHGPLLRAGVRIYRYGPPMIHAKTWVVDRDVAVVGTANLDSRSLRLHFEVLAAVYGGPLVEELAALFVRDLERARPGLADERAPLGRRLFASAARLLAPQL